MNSTMFLLVLLFVLLITANAGIVTESRFKPLSEELVRYINEESGATWKAARSTRFTNVEQFKKLLGAHFETTAQRNARRPTVKHNVVSTKLPSSFDSREKWPHCPSIAEIGDQSRCGSSWAFGATGAMTDRICIHSNGKLKANLSAADLLSCCSNCGYGCRGGYPAKAWDFWRDEGIVTGGSLEDGTGCRPYPFPKCSHLNNLLYLKPCPEEFYQTPRCERKCQSNYTQTYVNDKVYAKSSYNLPNSEEQIMYEIMTNGPVEAAFVVYADFIHYREGIYHRVYGQALGGQAVRIIGWGEEDGVKYWLLANSFNEEWGEKGYLRIRRGVDECRIESMVVAGMPRL